MRRLTAEIAWRISSHNTPTPPERMTLTEHFWITAGIVFLACTPYLLALKETP